MLSKGLKKFKDRIFSSSRKDGSQSGTDYSEGPESPGNVAGNSFRKFSSIKSKNSSYAERPPDLVATSSMRSNASAAHSILLKESPMLEATSNSPGAHVLPPVQISSSQNSFSSKSQQPPNLGGMTPSSGRRKSTPAALDMVLRTAEGKAAVEQLLQPGQNKLVFGNYFAGTSAAARDQAAAVAAAEKQRARAAATGPLMHAPKPPQVSSAPAPLHARPSLPALHAVQADISMATVPEDVAMDDVQQQQQQQQQQLAQQNSMKKHVTDSVSSMHAGYMPSSPSAPLKVLHPTPPPHQQPHSLPSVSNSHSAPQIPTQPLIVAPPPPPVPSPAVSPTPPQQPVAVEEATTSNRSGSKLVSLSPQLPAAMQRKYWSLADYNIIRKMYTGYASTVYQAMCKKSLEMVALKVYHMSNLCELNHYQVFREVRVHSSLQHQHVIHLFAAFQEGTDVVLVQEYAEGGDLYRLLHKNGGRLSERQAVEMVLHPFLLALHYLHMRGIMHSVDRIMHSVPEFPAKVSEFAKDFICQCLRKHPGDRPTVMELLHHPWIRTFQRRTSMRITTMPRRRSSVVFNPGSLTTAHGAGGGGAGMMERAYNTPPQEAAEGEAEEEQQAEEEEEEEPILDCGPLPAPMETDVNEMTPEQIERMIMKLQVAKAQAIAKSDSQRTGSFAMQSAQPLQI
ncbi:Serine/threonine-protein kinase Aurora-3, partial [Tetrabaena socialis]